MISICGWVTISITHVLQGYLIGIRMNFPVPVKQLWRMWVNISYESTKNYNISQKESKMS